MEEELATAVLLSPTRDPHKNGEIAQRWMEMVLGEKFRSAFPAVLLSGERLCDLANKVHRALGMSDEVVSEKAETSDGDVATSQAAKQNVSKYLKCGCVHDRVAVRVCRCCRLKLLCVCVCVCMCIVALANRLELRGKTNSSLTISSRAVTSAKVRVTPLVCPAHYQ